jgi:hypothetical protein
VRAGQSHITSIVVICPAPDVFARMGDASNLHRWSFGTWKTEIRADGLINGTSLFDGAGILVRIDRDEARLSIDYHLGPEPQKLVPMSSRCSPSSPGAQKRWMTIAGAG